MKNHLISAFYGIRNEAEFVKNIQQAINELAPQGIFVGDNLFTFNRNLSFLDDEPFMRAFENNIYKADHQYHAFEKSIIWRTHVLSWAARSGMKLEGDFVECACYRGTSAKILCEYLNFNKTDKHYYLYDLFEHEEGMDHHAMDEHGVSLYEQVKQRFVDYPRVHVIKGAVPQVLHDESPQKIAFMHLDINSAAAEIGALELLFDRIVLGGILVLDDYGWLAYRAQKEAEDLFFAARGYQVLELPTGQGLVVK